MRRCGKTTLMGFAQGLYDMSKLSGLVTEVVVEPQLYDHLVMWAYSEGQASRPMWQGTDSKRDTNFWN